MLGFIRVTCLKNLIHKKMKMINEKKYYLIILIAYIQILNSNIIAQPSISKDAIEIMAWKFKTNNSIYASPVIHNDILYIGSLDSSFYAINAKTGTKIWQFKLSNQVRSSAIISNNTILFESGNTLYALNLNGELLWKVDLFDISLQNQIDPWDFHHSSPVVNNHVVYIGTVNGLVYGIDIENGKRILKYQTSNKDIIRTTPVISEGKIYFGDWEGVMYAYNLNKGNLIWEYDTKKDTIYNWKNAIQSTPVVYNNSIFFAGRSSRLYSLNKKTGQKNWMHKSPIDQWLIGGLNITDGIIFIGSSDQQIFQAFDSNSGDLIWQTKVDSRVWGTAFVTENSICIGSNSFYIIDKTTGKIKTQLKFKKFHKDKHYGEYIDKRANIHSSPVLYENKIIFGSDDGFIYALDLSKI